MSAAEAKYRIDDFGFVRLRTILNCFLKASYVRWWGGQCSKTVCEIDKKKNVISNDDTSYLKPIRGHRRHFIFAKLSLTRTSQEIILLSCMRAQRSMRYCVTVSHNNIMSHTYIYQPSGILYRRIYVRVAISLIDILNLLRNNH